jgi:hypothetical protein
MNKLFLKSVFLFSFLISTIISLAQQPSSFNKAKADSLTIEIKDATLKSWLAYKQYAWGHDALMPISKFHEDWYKESLYISPIDAYSTLFLMGYTDETKTIEKYVVDSLNFDKDLNAKIFEVNIRILGGLLSMYELSKNDGVLVKAKDFADRMLPAFNTPTGIPTYWVNLHTGVASGDTVNVAEAATYTMELGALSYYTKDPKYYQAGKKATLAIYKRRSAIGLIGDIINVQTGDWVSKQSHICAGVDSYYEYLYKSYSLFGDPELGSIWTSGIKPVHKYLAEQHEGKLWYARADMNTGIKNSAVVTLYDAFFPAILALSGDMKRAKQYQASWNWLWNKYGLEPMVYDYKKATPNYPVYDLNPEIIESTYYLYHFTKDPQYFKMNEKYWNDIKKYCTTPIAYTSIEDVTKMQQKDYMPTFFFAETLKYFYLTFSMHQNKFNLNEYVFNTEAHPFKRSSFKKSEIGKRLGFTNNIKK